MNREQWEKWAKRVEDDDVASYYIRYYILPRIYRGNKCGAEDVVLGRATSEILAWAEAAFEDAECQG